MDEQFAARYYPGESPIGRRFRSGGCTVDGCPFTEIVGVVGNVKTSGLADTRGLGTIYYDFQRDTMVKINDRYEFPEELDLDVEDGKYFSPSADRSVRNLYRLHSVLVHSGGVHGGHYYAYIRPEVAGDDWLKFDDERVTKESAKKAIDEQFGGSDDDARTDNNLTRLTPPTHGFRLNKHSNAYMLVYVRESDKDEMLCHVDKSDILPHVRERLQREQAEKEKRRKEKQEAHL